MNCYYTKTFAKLAAPRRAEIMRLATREFAQHGYESASINMIAKKIGISIGAMYSYFESKENLFLSVIAHGVELLKMAIGEVDDQRQSFYQTLRALLETTTRYSRRYSDYVSLYHSLSTSSLTAISRDLTAEVERDFIAFYKKLLKRAIASGEVRSTIDVNYAALLLDNIIVMHELSVANRYHQQRLFHYLGAAKAADEAALIDALIDMIKRSLS